MTRPIPPPTEFYNPADRRSPTNTRYNPVGVDRPILADYTKVQSDPGLRNETPLGFGDDFAWSAAQYAIARIVVCESVHELLTPKAFNSKAQGSQRTWVGPCPRTQTPTGFYIAADRDDKTVAPVQPRWG